MTYPYFRPFGETAFARLDDGTLTAEHGRRLSRNALAIYNERCVRHGHGYATHDRFVEGTGFVQTFQGSRVSTARWAFRGPWYVYVPAAIAEARASAFFNPHIKLRVTAQAERADVKIVAVNPQVRAIDSNDLSGTGFFTNQAIFSKDEGRKTKDVTVDVKSGWNTVWLGVRCGLGDLVPELNNADYPIVPYYGNVSRPDIAVVSAWGSPEFAPYIRIDGVITPFETEYAPEYALTYGDKTGFEEAEPFTVGFRQSGNYDGGYFENYAGTHLVCLENAENLSPVMRSPSDVAGFAPTTSPDNPLVAHELGALEIFALEVYAQPDLQLEDRSFGAALRAYQRPSSRAFRQVSDDVRHAHLGRIPMVRIWNDTANKVTPRTLRPFYDSGQAGIWRTIGPGDGGVEHVIARVSLGTPDEIQRVTYGSFSGWEARVPVCIINRIRRAADAPNMARVRLKLYEDGIMKKAGPWSEVVTGDGPGPGSATEGGDALWRWIYRTGFPDYGGSGKWGGDGLTTQEDMRHWVGASCMVAIEQEYLEDFKFYTLEVEIQKLIAPDTPSDVAGRLFAVGDVAIRMMEA